MALEITETHAALQTGSIRGSQSTFVVIFIAFLLTAMVALLLGQNWRDLLPGAEGEQSVLGGVKSAVYTVMSELV
jgi:hypothetical protein